MHYLTSNEWVHQILLNGGKNMSFFIKDDEVWEKYKQIWVVIKNKLKIKFDSLPVYDKKILKN